MTSGSPSPSYSERRHCLDRDRLDTVVVARNAVASPASRTRSAAVARVTGAMIFAVTSRGQLSRPRPKPRPAPTSTTRGAPPIERLVTSSRLGIDADEVAVVARRPDRIRRRPRLREGSADGVRPQDRLLRAASTRTTACSSSSAIQTEPKPVATSDAARRRRSTVADDPSRYRRHSHELAAEHPE